MPLTVTVTASGPVVANRRVPCVAAIGNTGASDVTLDYAQAFSPQSFVSLEQPAILTPNVAVSAGNPTITAGGTSYFPFSFIALAPNVPASSPNNAPGGVVPGNNAYPAGNANVTISVTAQASDDSVTTGSVVLGVLSAVAPFPKPEGGALQFEQGANFMTLALMGCL